MLMCTCYKVCCLIGPEMYFWQESRSAIAAVLAVECCH